MIRKGSSTTESRWISDTDRAIGNGMDLCGLHELRQVCAADVRGRRRTRPISRSAPLVSNQAAACGRAPSWSGRTGSVS